MDYFVFISSPIYVKFFRYIFYFSKTAAWAQRFAKSFYLGSNFLKLILPHSLACKPHFCLHIDTFGLILEKTPNFQNFGITSKIRS